MVEQQATVNNSPNCLIQTIKLLRRGKTEVRRFVEDNEIDIIIFDDELSFLNWYERIFKCKVLQRSNLILDIFIQKSNITTQVS